MAKNAAIGNVETIYVKSNDTSGNALETNISKGFKVNANATYQEVDTAIRALWYLNTDSYDDTILVTKVSVNEEVDDE